MILTHFKSLGISATVVISILEAEVLPFTSVKILVISYLIIFQPF